MKTQVIKTTQQAELAKMTLGQIAFGVLRNKETKVSPTALPYLQAMTSLTDLADTYYSDSARSVVLYFLSNANTMRGEYMRDVKAELNNRLKVS